MIFYVDNENEEFDFSILVEKHDDVSVLNGEIPEFISNDVVNVLHKAFANFANNEYRFIGFINAEGMVIIRCYIKCGRIWENVFYDDLVDILSGVENNEKIINCLMYEKS